jgi:hypothetical protein
LPAPAQKGYDQKGDTDEEERTPATKPDRDEGNGEY